MILAATLVAVASLLGVLAAACGGETVVETVIVEKQVPGDKVVETVVVEKSVPGEKVVETVVVVATPTTGPISGDVPGPRGRPGTMTFAVLDVRKGVGINSAGSTNYQWSITEAPFMTEFPGKVVGMVIDSWEKIGNELTLTVKDGVEFHRGWGELDAADVAWNFNDMNADINPESISFNAGDYAAMFGEAVAVDDKTVKIDIKAWDVRWSANQLNDQGQTIEIFSKKAFDEKGRDWMIENIIGTGPFECIEFRDDERIITEAVADHHRQTPLVTGVTYLEVPEAAARKAMLNTGEVDGAELILPDRRDLREKGFTWVPANSGKEQVVIFGGNYWEEVDADDGSALNPWDLPGYETDLPWVGCPWPDKCGYDDTNNPAGMDDMEQARLVRWAMAMAYDRELINETIFAGQADLDYISMFIPSLPEFQDKWIVPYDPAKSEEYLDQAGFPRGSDGVRFEHKFITFAGFGEEILQGIAGFWEEIGIKTESQIVDYRGVFRPTVVDRTNSLVYIQGCRHNNGLPMDWPRGPQNTSLTRGGFGCGIEMPWIAEAFLAANEEEDAQKRIEINSEVADKMHNWMPQSGIIVQPNGVVVNPRSIKSWQMLDGFESPNIQGPEYIVPVAR